MSDDKKLSACPLCGSASHIMSPVHGIWNVACGSRESLKTCGLVLFGNSNDSKADMIRKWNARVK